MTQSVRISGAVFASVAAGILLLAVAATLAMSSGASDSLRLPFRLLCHGIESRSLLIAGEAMPICSRCTAIYVGMLAGVGAGLTALSRWQISLPGWAAFLLASPMILDGVTQLVGLRESTNDLRIATGLVAGFAFLFWAITAIGANTDSGEAAVGTGF